MIFFDFVFSPRFYLIGPTAQRARLPHLLTTGLASYDVTVTDVASHYAVLNLVGPNAEAVLRRAVDVPVDLPNFRNMTARVRVYITVYNIQIMAAGFQYY